MRIYNNIPALVAYNSLTRTNSALARSISKLSTGLRINSAADDAAGLAISEKMRAQIRGLDRASANAQDGISMIQTAEGSLSETTSILQRMRELSVQAANDTLTQQDRSYIQLEIDQLKEEVNRIANTTQFNKKKLLDGSASVLWSSDSLDTKLFVRGGLRQIDQFGQKNVKEGNYKVQITATPGVAQVQKTDIFKIKHKNVLSNLAMDDTRVSGVKVDNLPAGTYAVKGFKNTDTVAIGGAIASGTWIAAGSHLSAGATYAAGSTFTQGAIFSAAGASMVFGNWASFVSGTIFSGAVTFAANQTLIISAGYASATVISDTTIAAGSVVGRGTSATVFFAGMSISAGTLGEYILSATYNTLSAIVSAGGGTWVAQTYTAVQIMNSYNVIGAWSIEVGANTDNSSILFTTLAAVSNSVGDYTVREGQTGLALGGNANLKEGTLNSAYKLISNATLAGGVPEIASSLYAVRAGTGGTNANLRVTTILKFDPYATNIYQTFGLSGGGNYGMTLSSDGIDSAGNASTFSGTANILLEVMGVANGLVTFKALAQVLDANGDTQTYVVNELQVREGEGARWTAFGVAGQLFNLGSNAILNNGYSVGDKMTIGLVSFQSNNPGSNIVISGSQNTAWDASWASTLPDINFAVINSSAENKDVHFRSFYLNTSNGTVYESDIAVSFKNNFPVFTSLNVPTKLATFDATYIGQTAQWDTQLRDLDKFWDANGKFMLDDPQTLTITQGDGTRTGITLYSTDTINDVRDKLNNAIANGLGQAKYLANEKNDGGKFVTYVDKFGTQSEAVQGTFVIRSIVNGQNGTISFAGDEDIIKALSLNVIQQERENQFSISIYDAHDGSTVASNVKIANNVAIGILHPNLDFEFKSTANMSTVWNDISKSFVTKADIKPYETIIHVADNTAVFQIGANEGEDMSVDIGDMSSRAIGIHKVLVTDQKSAARSITIIDGALDRVSSQRARLGAFQNRLDHTINNLTIAGENLTAAESRIRDLDMAKEMMNFTKLNILMQAGNSMLGQANQLPQNVLALLR